MPEIYFTPLNESFGVEVHGVDVAKQPSARVMHKLALAYVEHRVLLLRNQSPTLESYTNFAHAWGKPRNDGFTDLNVPGFHDLSRVGNTGGLLEEEMHRNGSCFWHTDCAAENDANATTMLYCLHAPLSGGETLVADLQGAYDTLDQPTRDKVESLAAHHSYPGTQQNIDGREDWEFPFTDYDTESISALPKSKLRPLVRRHSATGRKGLYSPAGSIMSIDGMDLDEASALARRLKLHAVAQANCYRHSYRPGDILLWDNSATLHFATPVGPANGEANRRLLYRIVPVGLPTALGL
jgi:alpha-ketoglutarate-dependent taurine dioxygenase